MYRKMVNEHKAKITQGAIFSCAYSPYYDKENILGIVISARCDIAQKKLPQYYYLPVIPFTIWKKCDLPKILKHRYYKEKQKQLNNLIGGVETLQIFGLQSIRNKLSELLDCDKKKKKKEQQIIEIIEVLDALGSEDIFRLKDTFEKEIKSFVKSIIENKEDKYFFIDKLNQYGSCMINLFDINVISSQTIDNLDKGIELSNGKKWGGLNNISAIDNFAYVIGELESPYIEHVMQKFALGLIRVGLESPNVNDMTEELMKI